MSVATYEDDEIVVSADQFAEPCPEGRHPAICIDVIPAGEEEEEWNGRKTKVKKVIFVWQVYPLDGSRQENGKPFLIDAKMTLSINHNSRMRLMLERWRNNDPAQTLKPFTPEEVKSFVVSNLKENPKTGKKGATAYVNVYHKINNGFISALIQDDMIRDERGQERKFYSVEYCNGAVGAALKAELEHYDRSEIIRKYERMAAKMAERKAAQASNNSQPIPETSNDKSNWVPF
jgi:hypothetical protein